jgi:hypothetical protein
MMASFGFLEQDFNSLLNKKDFSISDPRRLTLFSQTAPRSAPDNQHLLIQKRQVLP